MAQPRIFPDAVFRGSGSNATTTMVISNAATRSPAGKKWDGNDASPQRVSSQQKLFGGKVCATPARSDGLGQPGDAGRDRARKFVGDSTRTSEDENGYWQFAKQVSAMDRPSMATPDTLVAHERRRHRRVHVAQPATIDLGLRRAAALLNVSESGVGVQASCHTVPGVTTSLSFTLPGFNAPIKSMGTVAWSDESGHIGLEFRQLAQDDRERLARWIAHQQSGIPAGAHVLPEPVRRAAAGSERADGQVDSGVQQAPSLEAAMRRLSALTSATGAAVALENGGGMTCVATWGNAPGLNTHLDPRSGLSGECVRTGTVVRCEDTERDPRIDCLLYRRLNLRSMVIVPVLRQSRVVGVIEVFSNVPHAFDSTHIELLTRVAELVGSKNGVAASPAATQPPPRQTSEEASAPETAEVARVPAPAQSKPEIPKAVEMNLGTEPAAPPAVSDKGSEAEEAAGAAAPASPPAQIRQAAGKKSRARRAAQPMPRPNIFRRTVGAFSTLVRSALVVWFTTLLLLGGLIAYRHTVRVRTAQTAVTAQPSKTIGSSPSNSGGMEDLGARLGDAVARLRGLVGSSGATGTPSEAASPAAAATPQLSGGQVLKKVEPVYPEAARKQRLQGPVILRVEVGKDGRVQRVEALRGHPILATAAKAAVKRWRYEPFRVDGEPIAKETLVTVPFPAAQP